MLPRSGPEGCSPPRLSAAACRHRHCRRCWRRRRSSRTAGEGPGRGRPRHHLSAPHRTDRASPNLITPAKLKSALANPRGPQLQGALGRTGHADAGETEPAERRSGRRGGRRRTLAHAHTGQRLAALLLPQPDEERAEAAVLEVGSGGGGEPEPGGDEGVRGERQPRDAPLDRCRRTRPGPAIQSLSPRLLSVVVKWGGAGAHQRVASRGGSRPPPPASWPSSAPHPPATATAPPGPPRRTRRSR